MNIRKILAIGLLIATLFLLVPTISLLSVSAVDTIPVVYIGAHDDDVEIGMCGQFFKCDYGRHNVLWIVVTDGGADKEEYNYDLAKGWISPDKETNKLWYTPNGGWITRPFYSYSLSRNRVGAYISSNTLYWYLAYHPSTWGTSYDWHTRIVSSFGSTVTTRLLTYTVSGTLMMYPDAGLALSEAEYTNSIALNLAKTINTWVVANGLSKSQTFINTHACSEVAYNYREHSDHGIVGNGARMAVDILKSMYGFGNISVTWYTIYKDIQPKSPYTKIICDVSAYKTNVESLNKLDWEAQFISSWATSATFDCWTAYPTNFEGYHAVAVGHYYY